MGKVKKLKDPKKKLALRKELRRIPIMLVLILLQSLAVVSFFKPAEIVTGGVTGVGMLISYATGGFIPEWTIVVLANIPLLLISFRKLHIRFTLYSLLMTVLFSGGLAGFSYLGEVLNSPALFDMGNTTWRVVCAVFGALMMGFGGAMIVRLGGSTGGFDIIAMLLNRKYSISMGTISMAINMVVAAALGILQGVQSGDFHVGIEGFALSVIALATTSMTFNHFIQGMNRTKTLFIISDRWDEIAPHVLNEAHRGVTLIPCKGAYTNRDKTLVYIIAKTADLARIRRIVQEHDERAILSVIDTREVIGKGFTAVN